MPSIHALIKASVDTTNVTIELQYSFNRVTQPLRTLWKIAGSIERPRHAAEVCDDNDALIGETITKRNNRLAVEAQERALKFRIYELEVETQIEEKLDSRRSVPLKIMKNRNATLNMLSS